MQLDLTPLPGVQEALEGEREQLSPNPDIVPKGIHGKDGPSPSEPERALGPPPRIKPNREGAAPPGKSSFPASPRSPRSSLSGRPPPSPAGPQASGPRPVQNSDNFRRGNGLITVDLSSINAPGLGARSRRVIAVSYTHLTLPTKA